MTKRSIAAHRRGQRSWTVLARRWRTRATASLIVMSSALLSLSVLPGTAQAVTLQSAPSAASTSTSTPDASQREAVALLSGIYPTALRLHYEGTFVFQRGGTVQSSRLVHFVDNGNDQYQKIDGLDGEPRSVIQHNVDLFTFLPASHTVILDRRKSQDNFPALLSAGSSRVLQTYRATTDGDERVAGRDCRIVLLKPIDAYRFTYRLYIDRPSGLLIRVQTLDSDAHVLEQVGFSQLQIGALSSATKKSIRDRVRRLNDWKQVRAPLEAVDMEAAGWTLDSGVAGFQKVLELRRPMAARDANAPPVPVDQAVFSDGVTTVSLFIEPVDKSDRKPGEGKAGATHLLAEQHGAFWVTLIGEVPAATLRKFADSIQYRAP